MSVFVQDPQAVLDYSFDFTPWLATGETITAATVTATAGLTIAPTGKPTAHNGKAVTYWVAGGTAGQRYDVTCSVTTSAGRSDDRTVRITVLQR